MGIGPDATEVWVNHELFANCTPLMTLYNKTLGDRGLYKYEIESDEVNVAFKMIRDNVTTVRLGMHCPCACLHALAWVGLCLPCV